ncbi:hypothetical protein M144_0300 [Bacteroides fragilis str. 3-F-2 |nr:hypothetical protein M071_0276 [Bacteroides fragilis str. Ds-233]EXZ80503.1 hypothetical protein M144_0300 [Bacteroides fragilis str. 3-F-2 \
MIQVRTPHYPKIYDAPQGIDDCHRLNNQYPLYSFSIN